jgi:hypothetical protein
LCLKGYQVRAFMTGKLEVHDLSGPSQKGTKERPSSMDPFSAHFEDCLKHMGVVPTRRIIL